MTRNVTFTTMTTFLAGLAGAALATLVFGPKAEARTPQPVSGNCIIQTAVRADHHCTVTPDSGGGYIIDTHGGVHENFYVNPQARELYYGPNSCAQASISSSGNFTSAMCVSSDDIWTVIFPTR